MNKVTARALSFPRHEDDRGNTGRKMGKEAMYSGRVQGVGFRQSICSLVSGSKLRGYVQNLDNGKVRLVVEGDEVDHLLQKIVDLWSSHIADIQITDVNTSGMFSNFNIRY